MWKELNVDHNVSLIFPFHTFDPIGDGNVTLAMEYNVTVRDPSGKNITAFYPNENKTEGRVLDPFHPNFYQYVKKQTGGAVAGLWLLKNEPWIEGIKDFEGDTGRYNDLVFTPGGHKLSDRTLPMDTRHWPYTDNSAHYNLHSLYGLEMTWKVI